MIMDNSVCNKCGKCCRAIRLADGPEKLQEYAEKGNTDAIFVLENWTYIILEEALELNPHLIIWFESDPEKALEHWYTCTKLDKETGKCTIWNDPIRPRVCRDYPFYDEGKLKPGEHFYDVDCAYNLPEYKQQLQQNGSI